MCQNFLDQRKDEVVNTGPGHQKVCFNKQTEKNSFNFIIKTHKTQHKKNHLLTQIVYANRLK